MRSWSFVVASLVSSVASAHLTAPESAPDATPEAASDAAPAVESGAPLLPGVTPQEAAAEAVEAQASTFELFFGGYLRTKFGTFTPDRFFFIKNTGDGSRARNPYVGRNDGFALGTARFNVRGSYGERLYVRLAFDGAVATYDSPNDPAGTLSTAVRDAYARFSVLPELQVFVGRFRPPYDVESLTPEAEQVFVNRSLESRGVLRHEGFASDAPGFGMARQTGIMIGSGRALVTDAMAFGYALAVTNGTLGDEALNDNDLPAVWLRLTAGWAHGTQPKTDEEGPATYAPQQGGGIIGLSGFYNEISFDAAPNRTHERVVGAGFDFAVREWIFDVRGQLLWQRTQPVLRVNTESVDALGGHAQLGLAILGTGFLPAYRFAYYDGRIPSTETVGDTGNTDRVMHHTVGVKYTAQTLPVRGWLEYTHSVEQGGRRIPNDRVEAALQVNFE